MLKEMKLIIKNGLGESKKYGDNNTFIKNINI